MIPFDRAVQQARIKDTTDAGIRRVLVLGQYILGLKVAELKKKLADFVGTKYCIAYANLSGGDVNRVLRVFC